MTVKVKKIITHPSVAHRDEFLAVCLAIHVMGCRDVERRAATQEEMNDPEVMVIDEQGVHDPEGLKFDHHHKRDLKSSLHLVAAYFGLDKLLEASAKWYPTVDREDRGGAPGIASDLRISVEDVTALLNDPIRLAIIGQFSDYTQVPAEFINLMETIGADMVTRAKEYADDYKRLEEGVKIEEVNGIKYFIDTERTHIDAGDFAREERLSEVRKDFARKHGVAVIVSPARRSAGWDFKRIDDAPNVDFQAAADHPDLQGGFVHANGFMASSEKPDASIDGIIAASFREQAIEVAIVLSSVTPINTAAAAAKAAVIS